MDKLADMIRCLSEPERSPRSHRTIRKRTRLLASLLLTAPLALAVPASQGTAASPPAVDPVSCEVPEGTTVLPDNCSDPGDLIKTDTDMPDLSVPVPGPGQAVAADAIMDDGSSMSIRVHKAEDGRVESLVEARSDDSGDRSMSRGECSDSAYSFLQFPAGANETTSAKWYSPLTWRFKINSSPTGITQADAIKFIQQGLTNIATGRNSCGLPDQISASGSYVGTTNAQISPWSGGCTQNDGLDVVGFKDLGANHMVGLTCVWSISHVGLDQIVSADIAFDTSGRRWYLPGRSCSGALNVEGVATHEFGHAFGMGHVAESTHGNLTMSTAMNDYCGGEEMTLGRGDILGLQQLY